jgi:hypothetical protein
METIFLTVTLISMTIIFGVDTAQKRRQYLTRKSKESKSQ